MSDRDYLMSWINSRAKLRLGRAAYHDIGALAWLNAADYRLEARCASTAQSQQLDNFLWLQRVTGSRRQHESEVSCITCRALTRGVCADRHGSAPLHQFRNTSNPLQWRAARGIGEWAPHHRQAGFQDRGDLFIADQVHVYGTLYFGRGRPAQIGTQIAASDPDGAPWPSLTRCQSRCDY